MEIATGSRELEVLPGVERRRELSSPRRGEVAASTRPELRFDLVAGDASGDASEIKPADLPQ